MRFFSPAKLNLFLHLTGRRDDGYHNLETLFQLIDFNDELHFSDYQHSGALTLNDNLDGVAPEDNLILKAARALADTAQCSLGARITLTKRIPMGGGLGGGSSNAATTLIALNQLWDTQLNQDELCEIGLTLGADVPVFVGQQTALASGLGEQLMPVQRAAFWYLLIIPQCHVTTAELFAHPELNRNTPSMALPNLAHGYWSDADWFGRTRNDFEPVARASFPDIETAFMLAETVGKPRLTGTGACLFCEYPDRFSAEQAQKALREQCMLSDYPLEHHVVAGISHTPAPISA